jgi:hypothetical protein
VQRISVLPLVLAVCFTTAMQAQAPAPKPDAEVKKLRSVVGHWTYEGESQPGAWGPGGKSSGKVNCQMILGGSFLQCLATEMGASRETQHLRIDGYDPVNRNFYSQVYFDDGRTDSLALNLTGDTFTWAGKLAISGKQYQFKATFVSAPDSTSATSKFEISLDGKTWMPFSDARYTKVKPAAKK